MAETGKLPKSERNLILYRLKKNPPDPSKPGYSDELVKWLSAINRLQFRAHRPWELLDDRGLKL